MALILFPCCATGMAAVWLTYILLRKHARRKYQARSIRCMDERELEARDLQDTLLQDTQGLILRFQAIAEQLRKGDHVRQAIEDALDRADEVLAHDRERVSGQRAAAVDLPQSFAMAGAALSADAHSSFNILVEGSSKRVVPEAREAIYAAGREALTNAFRHADAHAVETHIVYGDSELRICVRDDGCGAAPGSIEKSACLRQSGVARMRASASALGARLTIWSRPGAGTEVELRIPSAVAYSNRMCSSTPVH